MINQKKIDEYLADYVRLEIETLEHILLEWTHYKNTTKNNFTDYFQNLKLILSKKKLFMMADQLYKMNCAIDTGLYWKHITWSKVILDSCNCLISSLTLLWRPKSIKFTHHIRSNKPTPSCWYIKYEMYHEICSKILDYSDVLWNPCWLNTMY